MPATICHARYCHTKIGPSEILCPAHWMVLPKDLQAELRQVWDRSVNSPRHPNNQCLLVLTVARNLLAELEGRDKTVQTTTEG